MYRIELAPGEETVFRTIEELAIGVRNGLVTPRCRIYHNASQKWLPIEFHPHYKQALALPASRVAEAGVPKPADRPRLDTLSFAVAPAHRVQLQASVDEPTAGHSIPAQPAVEHPVVEHPAALHPAPDHATAAPPTTGHPAKVGEVIEEHPGVAAPPIEPPVFDHEAPEYPFHPVEPHPPRTVDHSPAAPTPRTESAYRPDSYLPPSVRLIADDPFVAIAPEAAIEPPRDDPRVEAAPARRALEPEPLDLPTIFYPEITPLEEPASERAGASRGRRPVQVAIAVLVLAAGGYLAKSFYSPVRGTGPAPVAAHVDRPILPTESATPAARGAAKASSAVSPSAGVAAAPASSGFAAALEPRAMASGPGPKFPATSGVALPPGSATPDSTLSPAPLAPPPGGMDLEIPALPGGVPVIATPKARDDSAMKRILRAVGGRDAKQP